MRLKNANPMRRKEFELTGLINVVFLILIFFIVAGALRPFSARDIELATIAPDAGQSVGPARLIVHADSTVVYRGQQISLEAIEHHIAPTTEQGPTEAFIVVADGRLEARQLLNITRKIKAAGHKTVSVMSERVK